MREIFTEESRQASHREFSDSSTLEMWLSIHPPSNGNWQPSLRRALTAPPGVPVPVGLARGLTFAGNGAKIAFSFSFCAWSRCASVR